MFCNLASGILCSTLHIEKSAGDAPRQHRFTETRFTAQDGAATNVLLDVI